MSSENWWLEDVISFWNGPFSGDIRSFSGGVRFQMLTVHEVSAKTGWWFQICFMFTPIMGKIPVLTSIFFIWVETTNQKIFWDYTTKKREIDNGKSSAVQDTRRLQDEREQLRRHVTVGFVQLARGRQMQVDPRSFERGKRGSKTRHLNLNIAPGKLGRLV